MPNITGWPVMPAKCKTCPFGPDGDKQIEASVIQRIVTLSHSQICHHPSLTGKPDTHICRGARDLQLKLLTAFGMLDEPTDEAFERKTRELNNER